MCVQDVEKDLSQSGFGIKSKGIARLPVGIEKVTIYVAIAQQVIELEPGLFKGIKTGWRIGRVSVVVV